MPQPIGNLQDVFALALDHHRAGRAEEAVRLYASIVQQEPNHAPSWHLLGVAHYQRREMDEAVRCIARAIALESRTAVFYNSLGVAERGRGRLGEAERAYRQAVAIDPRFADAVSNLATVLDELGRHEEALSLFEEALRLAPGHGDALLNLGNLRSGLGQFEEALACYEKALALQPNRVDVLNNLGNALLGEGRDAEAVARYRQAVALAPDYAEASFNLGAAYAKQGQTAEAATCFDAAARLRPERELWRLRTLALCPVVFSSSAEMDRYRGGLEARLDRVLGEPLGIEWQRLAAEGFAPPFQLCHHGRNNRPLMAKFAALFAGRFPKGRPPTGSGKPRIGFLATRYREAGFLRDMAGIIERLDRSRLEVVVLCSRAILSRCQQAIANPRTQWAPFPDRFEAAAEVIAAAGCDLVYHWQIGTDPLNYFLAFAPIAPVQATGWGSHGTTGIESVDYYLSSRLIEPDAADSHFSESLVRLGTLASYQRRPAAVPPASRDDFGLPGAGTLYVCPERLEKLHPDCDPLFAGVLQSDPQAFLVLLDGKRPHPAALLRRRFETTLAGFDHRVIFLPSLGPADFYRLLSVADVFLDTPHYSAGFTAYDAFSVGLPIVTLPDGFGLGNYVRGFYRKMDLEYLAARTPEEYVTMAVRLGVDRDYRQSVRAILAERSSVLFEDVEAVREYERFFEHAVSRRRADSP